MDTSLKLFTDRDAIELNGDYSLHRLHLDLDCQAFGGLMPGADIRDAADLALAAAAEGFVDPGVVAEHDAAALAALALAGRALFDRVIPAGEQASFLAALTAAGEAGPGRPMVRVTGAATRVPWPLIYVGPAWNDAGDGAEDGQAPRLEHFLGAQYLFLFSPENPDALFLDNDEAGAPERLKTRWSAEQDGSLAHVWDDTYLLPSQPANRRWYAPLPPNLRRELKVLSNVATQRSAMDDDLRTFATTDNHAVLHFDCHGKMKPGTFDPSRVAIHVRKGFLAEHGKVSAWRFVGNPRLFATLNVCHSGGSRLTEEHASIAEAFLAQGMGGAVAPFAKVPYKLAMRLSRLTYDGLLAGATVREAFDQAQTQILKDDPTVLLFAIWADVPFADSVLAKPALDFGAEA